MVIADISYIELERGFQVLADGQSVGTVHKHRSQNFWHGTIGGSVNFTNTTKKGVVEDMLNFIQCWRSVTGRKVP